MTTEIELKYLLQPAEANLAQVNITEKITQVLTEQGYTFKIEEKKLSNYYLDTPELALRQLDMGLRVRGIQFFGQPLRHEQTIKTSGEVIGGLHKRPEYNVDIDDDQVNLALFPDEIWRKSASNVDKLQQAIVRLFNTHFERVTWTITLGSSVIELAFDQGIISCDDFDKSDVIYEIELELVSGEQQALLVLAKLLLAYFAMRPGHLSKAARGYALAAQFAQSKKSNCSPVKSVPVHEELALEIIPTQHQHTISKAFRRGLDFSLTKLQGKIDDYIDNASLVSLIKINELLALIRQGFWLFSSELNTEQLKIRDELSYFIRSLEWLDNAQHLQGLLSLSSGYRKKLAGSDKLIVKLKKQQEQFPDEQDIVELFHSERFNLMQLSLLELLLSDQSASVGDGIKQESITSFAQDKLNFALKNISNEMLKLDQLSHSEACDRYIDMHGLLVRSLLTGSWFSALFIKQNNKTEGAKQTVNYRRPWLDIKQGISELQTLKLLQQQLHVMQYSDNKVLAWLDNKVENLVQAVEQSRLKALSVTPYWHGNF